MFASVFLRWRLFCVWSMHMPTWFQCKTCVTGFIGPSCQACLTGCATCDNSISGTDSNADEAGQYLIAYKQSEHRPQTLIHECIDTTPNALLCTAITSIRCINKMDVETLRSSFGVRIPAHSFSLLDNTAHRASRRSHRLTQSNSRVYLDLAQKSR